MAADRLAGLDMAFLCLEHPSAPLHMGAVAVFQPAHPVDGRRLVTMLSERAQRIPRLRRRIRQSWFPTASAEWAEDGGFKADDHIRAHPLPAGSGHDELAELAARLMAEPLDMAQPPWQLHVITGLAGGRFALLAKLHHALCDGIEAVGLATGLFDGLAAKPSTATHGDTTDVPPAYAVARAAWHAVSRPGGLIKTVTDAAAGSDAALRRGNRALGIAASVLANSRLPDPSSPLFAAPSAQRRLGLLSLDIQDVRRIRRRHGGTVNDVVLTIVTGALRRWIASRGHPTEETVRALIPVSQRKRRTGQPDGNQLSGYLCELPVGEPNPIRRLNAIRTSMDRNKADGPQRGPGAVPLLAQELPGVLHRLAMPLARCAAPVLFDIVVTTVPLPGAGLSLDGAGLDEMYPLVPLAPGHALGIAIARYRDTIHIGLHADQFALADLEKLSDAFPDALADLAEAPTDRPT